MFPSSEILLATYKGICKTWAYSILTECVCKNVYCTQKHMAYEDYVSNM